MRACSIGDPDAEDAEEALHDDEAGQVSEPRFSSSCRLSVRELLFHGSDSGAFACTGAPPLPVGQTTPGSPKAVGKSAPC